MPSRLPFFEVSPSAYLYPEKVRDTANRKQPEEPVRQWCAYELIRAYGISVANIEFERPVRMGSRPHWIDILVTRNGKPAVVVECKKPADNKPDKAMEQAVSYVDAPEVRAEFAVCTNGTDWQVKRRIQGVWSTVPDLPPEIDLHSAVPVTDILRDIGRLSPLLYKLHAQVEGEDAQRFLAAMQSFFCGSNLLTYDIDHDLLSGTDNLLRVMSLADEHPNYRYGKLATAIQHFEEYRKRKSLGTEFYFNKDSIPIEIQYIHASCLNILETAGATIEQELFLLRLIAALTEYGMRQGRGGPLFPKISPSLHQALADFLNRALTMHLNATLPDTLDNILIGDMREFCQAAWEKIQVHERMTFREFVSAWFSVLLSKLPFSKDPLRRIAR